MGDRHTENTLTCARAGTYFKNEVGLLTWMDKYKVLRFLLDAPEHYNQIMN